MARRRKGGDTVKYTLLFGLFGLLVFFAWWGGNRIIDATRPQDERITDVESELDELRDEVSALEAADRWQFLSRMFMTLILTTGLVVPVSLWIKNRPKTPYKMMSIEESEKKSRELVLEREGREPLWVETGSFERREGRGKLYVHTFGFSPKSDLGVVNWDDTKIVLVENADWKHGRTDNIPRGVSVEQAIRSVVHERELRGMTPQRDERFTDAEAYFEHLGRIKQQRSQERGILEDLGFE